MAMKGPLTGRHVLIAILAFFGVIFAVNGVMTYIALDSFSGLATEDAYRKGLRYNEQIAAADAQAAKGWRVDVDYRERSGRISLTVRDKDELPLRSLQVTAGDFIQIELVTPAASHPAAPAPDYMSTALTSDL